MADYEGADEGYVFDNTALIAQVCGFLRIETDDGTVEPLVDAAIAYMTGAGIIRPDPTELDATAQYNLAVTLYVSGIFNGGENKLEPALIATMLQLRA